MGGTEGGGGELLIAVSICHVSIERTIGFSSDCDLFLFLKHAKQEVTPRVRRESFGHLGISLG